MKIKNFIVMMLFPLFLSAAPIYAADNNGNTINVNFNTTTITGSGSVTSDAISLNVLRLNGIFSLQLTTAGASSAVTVEYLLSLDGITYSDCGTDIKTGHAPGTMMYAFTSGEPMFANYIKFKLTETAGHNVTSFDLKLGTQ